MASILDMLGFGSGDAGADSPYLGILAAPQRQQIADNSRQAVAAALLAASGPSRLPTSFGSALGQAMLAGQQAEDTGVDRAFKQAYMLPQIQGLNLTNEEKNLELQGYRALQGLRGGPAASLPASNLGAMSPGPGPVTGGMSPTGILAPPGARPAPNLGVLDGSAADFSPVRTVPAAAAMPSGAGAASAMPAAGPTPAPTLTAQRQPDGSFAVPPAAVPTPVAAPAAATPPAATAGQPPPLFNVSNLYEQYKIMASTPKMAPLAAQVLQEIQKGLPEGAYLATDGSIQMRPGYSGYVQNKSTAESLGKDLMTIDPRTGQIINQPGAVASRAQSAGAVSGAQANAALPAKLAEIGATGAQSRLTETHKAGFEPMPIKVKNADGSYTTLTVPRAYLPQLAAAGQTPEGEPFYPPNVAENMKLDAEYLNKTLLPAKDAAVEAQGHAQTLFNSLEQMRQSKLTTPGLFAPATITAAKTMNDIIARLGGTPFKENEIAGADAFQKSSTRLAADMTRMLGSREAAQIFMQIQGANPNWYMQPASNVLVTNLINQASQRKIDSYQAGLGAVEKGKLSQVAVSAFDKEHPETEYVQRAFKLSGMDPAWSSKPQPAQRDINRLAMAPDKYADDFDKKFGPGRAAFVLGQRGGERTGAPAPTAATPSAPSQPSAPATPAIPQVLQGFQDLQWSPSRKQFRDPMTGTTFDATGKQVQ